MNPQGQASPPHTKGAETSPHRSGNSHGRLHATVPAEDALGTAWHGRAARETAAEMQESVLLPMHCGTDRN